MTIHRSLWLTCSSLLFAAALGLSGCATDPAVEVANGELHSTRVNISMTGEDTFAPDFVAIQPGTVVRFRNDDADDHTLTSGTGSDATDAGELFELTVPPGRSVGLRFNQPGAYPFFCRIHEGHEMHGVVQVLDPTVTTVNMTNQDVFSPPDLTVEVGSVVSFVNVDWDAHTLTSGEGSSQAEAGTLFDLTLEPFYGTDIEFLQPGDYPYFCRFHERHGMKGVVHVVEAGGTSEYDSSGDSQSGSGQYGGY